MYILHGLVFASLLVFVIAIAARAIRIASMPVHLRWELYPVPHEKGRAKHGGSRMEEVDWWTKSMSKDHLGELGVMIPEILLLKGVWDHNRPLWFGSWTLHFGLYLLIGNMFLLLLYSLLDIANIMLPVVVITAFNYLVLALGYVGSIMGTIGALIMLQKRIFTKKLSMYSTGSHYWNLIHLGIIYISALIWYFQLQNPGQDLAGIYRAFFTFSDPGAISVAGYIHIASVLLFFIYLPFTHMTHFFTKYFTYHDVRWEDAPNKTGSKLEKEVVKNVSQPVTWAAPHIQADGKKTWVDLVASTGSEKTEDK